MPFHRSDLIEGLPRSGIHLASFPASSPETSWLIFASTTSRRLNYTFSSSNYLFYLKDWPSRIQHYSPHFSPSLFCLSKTFIILKTQWLSSNASLLEHFPEPRSLYSWVGIFCVSILTTHTVPFYHYTQRICAYVSLLYQTLLLFRVEILSLIFPFPGSSTVLGAK